MIFGGLIILETSAVRPVTRIPRKDPNPKILAAHSENAFGSVGRERLENAFTWLYIRLMFGVTLPPFD
jgi:hypothetical protein